MTVSPEPPALAHVEKFLADSYRKEIDQEENIWRSLPFFAASLALQLATLFQLIERLPPFGSRWGLPAIILLYSSFGCSFVALSYLAGSFYKAEFRYIAKDTALLEYTLDLIADGQAQAKLGQAEPINPLVTLKEALARQYAVATDHNRRINDRREACRSVAGLATIGAVLSTLMLVMVTFNYYIPSHSAKGAAYGPGQFPTEPAAAGAGNGPGAPLAAPAGSINADSHQGVVDPTRGSGKGRGPGKGGQ